MRHRLRGRGFRRPTKHRRAMFENLAAALLKHEQITTTLPKAKDLRPIVERLITIGKHGGLANRRRAIAALQDAALADTEDARWVFAERDPHGQGFEIVCLHRLSSLGRKTFPIIPR